MNHHIVGAGSFSSFIANLVGAGSEPAPTEHTIYLKSTSADLFEYTPQFGRRIPVFARCVHNNFANRFCYNFELGADNIDV